MVGTNHFTSNENCLITLSFLSVKPCYAIGDSVEVQIKSTNYTPSRKDYIGLFLIDSIHFEKPLSSEDISNVYEDENNDADTTVDGETKTLTFSMKLKVDFPVKEDMASYKVRYISIKNGYETLAETEPFKISFVPNDEHEPCCGEEYIETSTTPSVTNDSFLLDEEKVAVEDKNNNSKTEKEKERRIAAERALEKLSRRLAEQIKFIHSQSEEIEILRSYGNNERSNNESLVEENKELQEQSDIIANEFKKAETVILNYKAECYRLGKELETTDRENSCLKFQIVNSEERLEHDGYVNVNIEDCREEKVTSDCGTLASNLESLENALEIERCRVMELKEDILRMEQQHELGIVMTKKMKLQYSRETQYLREKLALTSKAYDALVAEMEVQKIQHVESLESLEEKLLSVTTKHCDKAAADARKIKNFQNQLESRENEYNLQTKVLIEDLNVQYTEEMEKLKKEIDDLCLKYTDRKKSDIKNNIDVQETSYARKPEGISTINESENEDAEIEIQCSMSIERLRLTMKNMGEMLTNEQSKVKQLEDDISKAKAQKVEISENKVDKNNESKRKDDSVECIDPDNDLKSKYEMSINKLKNDIETSRINQKDSDKAYEKQIENLESRVANESSNASRLENELAISELRCRESEEDVKFFRKQLLDTEKKLQDGQTLLTKTLEKMNNLKNTAPHGLTNDMIDDDKNLRFMVQHPSSLCSQVEPSEVNLTGGNAYLTTESIINDDAGYNSSNNGLPKEHKNIPGIVRLANSDTSLKESAEVKIASYKLDNSETHPISVIEGRKIPKKKGRRFSKPINFTFAPSNAAIENDSSFSQQLDRTQAAETQYDAVRQHRNSLLRENTYLKNKVSSLMTDLLLMQKNYQDVVVDAEQKLNTLQLIIGNQYMVAAMMVQQNEMPSFDDSSNSYSLVESSKEQQSDAFPDVAIEGFDMDMYTQSHISDYGVIQSPLKKPSKMVAAVSEPSMNISPLTSISSSSSNYLSPLAEEYTPVSAQQRNVVDGLPTQESHIENVPQNSDQYLDYMDYVFKNPQTSYSISFPPPLPQTPLSNDGKSLQDVTQQLENIGIQF